MVAIVGLITIGLLYMQLRKKVPTNINIVERYNRLMLYRKYGSKRKLWINPFTKHVSDYETYYFDKKLVPKDDFYE